MQHTSVKTMQKMEVKKSRSAVATKPSQGRALVSFVGEVKQELKRVEWTEKGELQRYTKIVLVSTFVFAFFIFLVDLSIGTLLNGINLLVKFITG